MDMNPTADEINRAMKMPNGFVYRISGRFERNEMIPPEAIIGVWKVDSAGKIVGDFQFNPNYRSEEFNC